MTKVDFRNAAEALKFFRICHEGVSGGSFSSSRLRLLLINVRRFRSNLSADDFENQLLTTRASPFIPNEMSGSFN